MSVAVITGAAGGIGAGLAREAVRRGMNVVLADRDADVLADVAGPLGDKAIAVAADVTDPASVDALADAAWDRFGGVDLLFNNAGVLVTGQVWDIPKRDWDKAWAVNVDGVLNGLRTFVPRMLAAGTPSRIVNTSSIGGFLPSPLMSPYTSTKFAVVALTESLLHELTAIGAPIAVSLLAPGPVKSGIFRETPPEEAKGFHDTLTAMLNEHGLTGDEFAPLVLDAIERGEYWIIPQPLAFDDGFAARNAQITSRQTPHFHLVRDQ
ncbi:MULTISPECIES: SDR family NAD(P)-dependent oxidoreductase [unclassified Novosphingobium]|uniref:SDR family NAD(P)-dependent oxidoreductase n=1 Tax=unclassified Novosphingobium TaxID=2644732 RepID=UPI0003011897|nr:MULTISPECIES: SDR family NAD(P)-dependent oxidoreductase [unclassified Novosphingobium]GFM28834.1 short-chain dehydrogenase/reductase SDR [Novosphingobium sp. PY1]